MKKTKLVFIALALVAGIGGAFASRPDDACDAFQQFYFNGSVYQPVQGGFGSGWYCEWNDAFICTYYRPNPMQPNSYAPCKLGIYRTVF